MDTLECKDYAGMILLFSFIFFNFHFFHFRNNLAIEEYPTIEQELLKAFHKSGLITEEEYNTPNLMHFQRAARTDKGVSAIKQIISMNASKDVNTLTTEINQILPPQIRVFSAKRTTKYFDSKNFCDARTYSYSFPSFSICPLTEITSENYRISEKAVQEFNVLLNSFVGTHNFHNFTAQKKFSDASANRYIMSFDCSEPFMLKHNDKEVEFLIARIKGQSFMLHQIRKMVGLAIAIMRGFANQDLIQRAFGSERIDIPIAPGLGLLLEEVHYDRYNKKYGGDGIHEALVWDEYNTEIHEFKHKHIYPRIVETEMDQMSMHNWLSTLPLHSFDLRTNPINGPLELEKPLVKAHYNATDSNSTKRAVGITLPPINGDNDEDFDEQQTKKAKIT